MLVTTEQLQYYNYFISNLFQTNQYTSTDPNRTKFDNTTGNSFTNEKIYWINKLIAGLSEEIVTEQFNIAYKPKIITKQISADPLAETFLIDASVYPNGRFLSSIEIFFATKDDSIPVTLEIRPVVNGYPSSSLIVPLSEVTLKPTNVMVPTNINNGLGDSTIFKFKDIVYLKPGEYAFVLRSNSNNYNVYISEVGKVTLGNNTTVVNNNYIGVLFKSQNASTWTAEQNLDICFKINACKFSTGDTYIDLQSQAKTQEFQFDYSQLISQNLTFSTFNSLNYQLITKDNTTKLLGNPNPIYNNKIFQHGARQTAANLNDATLRISLSNIDQLTSPIVDLERLGSILIKNNIDVRSNTIDSSEILPSKGLAQAKYISKRIQLNKDFNATGITVYVDVNRQQGTSIDVFYKVLNVYDLDDFDLKPYVKMTAISTLDVTGIDEFVEDEYQNLNITYTTPDGRSYNNFNTVAIKIVMYSDNISIVPEIKKLRIIATA